MAAHLAAIAQGPSMNLSPSQRRPVLAITGATGGIGEALCLAAAQQGYDLLLGYHQNTAKAQNLVKTCQYLGADALAVCCDLSQPEQIQAWFQAGDSYFGRLDALVNNAAVLRQKSFWDTQAEELSTLLAINVTACFITARQALERMAKSRGGRGGAIVNVSSIAARLGSPGEYIDYAASKAALDTFTLGLGKEMAAEGVRVNAVRPGIIDTQLHAKGGEAGRAARLAPMIPMQRPGQADEVVAAILWLLSDAASYVTATCLDVSGGR